jgi:hypothetical protein
LGLGWPITDRIYAYYPDSTYADFEAFASPLVEAHPDGCPTSPETDRAEDLIRTDTGRPLQRLIFMMDPTDPDYRPEMIPVGNIIRFLTTAFEPPQLSAPAPGMTVSSEVTLYWQLPPNVDTSRVQITTDSDFRAIVFDEIVAGDHVEVNGLADGAYHWRVSYGREEWSEVWDFVVVPGTATEDDGSGIPTRLQLKAPFPNPGTGPITLIVGVPSRQRVSLAVYDLLGRRVGEISDREFSSGWHAEIWNPGQLASGLYFLKGESASGHASQPVVITK